MIVINNNKRKVYINRVKIKIMRYFINFIKVLEILRSELLP